MNPVTFWTSRFFTEQLQAYTLQGASFSKENFWPSTPSLLSALSPTVSTLPRLSLMRSSSLSISPTTVWLSAQPGRSLLFTAMRSGQGCDTKRGLTKTS